MMVKEAFHRPTLTKAEEDFVEFLSRGTFDCRFYVQNILNNDYAKPQVEGDISSLPKELPIISSDGQEQIEKMMAKAAQKASGTPAAVASSSRKRRAKAVVRRPSSKKPRVASKEDLEIQLFHAEEEEEEEEEEGLVTLQRRNMAADGANMESSMKEMRAVMAIRQEEKQASAEATAKLQDDLKASAEAMAKHQAENEQLKAAAVKDVDISKLENNMVDRILASTKYHTTLKYAFEDGAHCALEALARRGFADLPDINAEGFKAECSAIADEDDEEDDGADGRADT